MSRAEPDVLLKAAKEQTLTEEEGSSLDSLIEELSRYPWAKITDLKEIISDLKFLYPDLEDVIETLAFTYGVQIKMRKLAKEGWDLDAASREANQSPHIFDFMKEKSDD